MDETVPLREVGFEHGESSVCDVKTESRRVRRIEWLMMSKSAVRSTRIATLKSPEEEIICESHFCAVL